MAQKTKTTKKEKTEKETSVMTDAVDAAGALAIKQTNEDAKNALLIVSLTINAFVLIGWITLQVTNAYDYQVAAFLFTR